MMGAPCCGAFRPAQPQAAPDAVRVGPVTDACTPGPEGAVAWPGTWPLVAMSGVCRCGTALAGWG